MSEKKLKPRKFQSGGTFTVRDNRETSNNEYNKRKRLIMRKELENTAPRDATNVVILTNPNYNNDLLNTTILPKVVVEYDKQKKVPFLDGVDRDDKRDKLVKNDRPREPLTDRMFSTAGFLGRLLQFVPHRGAQTAGNLLSLADIGYDMYKVSNNNTLNNKDTEDLVSDVTLGSNYKPPISKAGSKIGKLRLLYYLTNANAMYHDFSGMTNTDVIYSPYKKNTSYTGVYR